MPLDELNDAMDALREALRKSGRASLPELVKSLESPPKLREDTIRKAFWILVGEGELELNEEFEAALIPAAA